MELISIEEQIPEKGIDIIGYDRDGQKYRCFRCACANEKCMEWRCSVTGCGLIVDIVKWKYEKIMTEFIKSTEKIDYIHYVEYDGKKYIREEVIFSDFHTISWLDHKSEEVIEYYSHTYDNGKGGWSNKTVPEIEKIFKKTIGKHLIYF